MCLARLLAWMAGQWLRDGPCLTVPVAMLGRLMLFSSCCFAVLLPSTALVLAGCFTSFTWLLGRFSSPSKRSPIVIVFTVASLVGAIVCLELAGYGSKIS